MKYYVVVGRRKKDDDEWRVWNTYSAADRLGVSPVRCAEQLAIYSKEMSDEQKEEWLRDTGSGHEWKIVEVEV